MKMFMSLNQYGLILHNNQIFGFLSCPQLEYCPHLQWNLCALKRFPMIQLWNVPEYFKLKTALQRYTVSSYYWDPKPWQHLWQAWCCTFTRFSPQLWDHGMMIFKIINRCHFQLVQLCQLPQLVSVVRWIPWIQNTKTWLDVFCSFCYFWRLALSLILIRAM